MPTRPQADFVEIEQRLRFDRSIVTDRDNTLGITFAQYFYRWYDRKFHRKGERA